MISNGSGFFQAFFVGIESKVAAGVRVEEVGYQLQFSKQELRKVIKEYSGREVCTFSRLFNLCTVLDRIKT